MAPYNNGQYGSHYDPVGSQYNQQQSYNYSYGSQRPTATSHNQEPATTSAYQTPTYPTPHSNNSYYNNTLWSTANAQPQSTTENRAAETLSHLSAQEHGQGQTSSTNTRDTNAQYGTSAWGDSTYNNTAASDSTVATPHHRTTSNTTSPLYPTQTNRPHPNVSGYGSGSAQSYTQPATSAFTYSYPNTSQTPTVDPPRPTKTRTPPTGYAYPPPSVATSTAQHSYQSDSPYLTQQQQQKSKADKTTSSTARRTSISNSTAMQTRATARDQYQQSSRPANTGQPRAPSLTPTSVQQQAGSQYARQSPPITVDPTQVYDPWPEQQTKYKQIEEKRRVEAAVRAERQEKERKLEEEKKRIDDEKKRFEEEKKKADEETARQRHAEPTRIVEEKAKRHAANQDMLAREAARRDNPPSARQAQSALLPTQPPQSTSAPKGADELEAEMLQMFQKMREYNAKNPSLLARLWEQERQTHMAKTQSPTPAVVPLPATTAAAPLTQPSPITTPVASTTASTMTRGPRSQAEPASKPGTALTITFANASASIPARSPAAPAASTPKPATAQAEPATAIWPPGKKSHLAEAAAKWLNAKPENANKHVTAANFIDLLNGNPSYLTLCETLESMGLTVDRAAFARALLSSVPDINKTNVSQVNSVNRPMVISQLVDPAGTPGVTLEAPTTKSGKKKSPNVGKYPGQRGRPRKDGSGVHQTAKISTPSQAQTGINVAGSGSTADSTGEGLRWPNSLAQMYQDALRDQPGQNDTVAYQSDFSYAPPPDDEMDDDMPEANSTNQLQRGPQPARASLGAQPVRTYQSPYFGTSTVQPPSRPNSQAAKSIPLPPRRPPASKEEAARKRTFADLVDLTADQFSDEDLPHASKYPNTQQYPITGVHMPDQQWAHTNFQRNAYDDSLRNNFTTDNTSGPAGPATQPTQTIKPTQPTPAPITNLASDVKGKELVQAIRREKVARKSKYDPRTICRDVLLATGRHPEMHNLNQHLFSMSELLRTHSVDVEMEKFDLATIRWDLIDPGEPIPEAADHNNDDADDEGDGEQDNPAVSIEKPAFQLTKGGQLVKPFGKKKGKVGRPPRSIYKPTGQSTSSGETPEVATPNTLTSKPVTNATFNAINTPKPGLNGSESSMTPGSVPVGYTAFNATNVTFDEKGNRVKKMGRPVGWRKAIHSKAALAGQLGGTSPATAVTSANRRQGQAAPSDDSIPRRRGRPSTKNLQANKDPEPEFNEYRCEWEDCTSKLHNIDTLRKHVIKIHGKKTSEGEFECAWRGCFRPSTDTNNAPNDSDPDDPMYSYDNMEPWVEHVEVNHIKPLMWTLGDGPTAGLSGPHESEASEAYLSDASGRMVTPKIVVQHHEVGTPEHAAAQRRVLDAKRLSELQGSRLEGEKLLQQLEEKIRVVGPGLDRGGCTLATAERRRGFIDDEDFEDIIENDDVFEPGGWRI